MRINKGQFRLEPWWRNFLFELKRGQKHLIPYLLNRFRWHWYPRLQYVSQFPDHVDIEISSACNLSCPMCYTITEEFKKKVKHTLMDFSLFKKIIDECAKYKIYSVRLSLRGEPFLHPKIFEMIQYAKEKGIKEVSMLTNGLALNPEKFERLVNLQLDWLTISFDGLGETYEKIRRPAKFKEALEKIKTYHQIKKKRGSVKPVIKVQSIWPAIADDPLAYYNTFKDITDQIAANPLIDYLRKDTKIEYEKGFTCPVLWQRLTIGSNGLVLLCSNDEMNEYPVGDANKQTIYEIWHGDELNKARNLHLQKIGYKVISPCRYCYYPRKTKPTYTLIGNKMVKVEQYTKRTQKIGR